MPKLHVQVSVAMLAVVLFASCFMNGVVPDITQDEYTLTIVVYPHNAGLTMPSEGIYTYPADTLVDVVWIHGQYSMLDHWELNGTNVGDGNEPYESSITVMMNASYILTCVYYLIEPFNVVSITPPVATVERDSSVNFVANVTGGMKPYSFQWYVNNARVAMEPTGNWNFTPTTEGLYSVFFKAKDTWSSAVDWKQSDTAWITVKSATQYTIVVPDDFASIQDAINNATDGDTVFVRSGTYYEHVVVNKAIALIGEDPTTTIIDGNNAGQVVAVMRDNVNVSNFTVQRGGNVVLPKWDAGICLNRTSGCKISGNIVVDHGSFGISLWYSDQNLISGNNVARSAVFGVILTGSSGNTVSSNNVLCNPQTGIDLHAASHNNIICENAVVNSTYALILNDARSNIISGNQIADCDEGIWIQAGAGNNTINGNNLTNNLDGIKIEEQANNCMVSGNSVTGSQKGIYILNAEYTDIFNNTIVHNYGGEWDAGIRLDYASYTRIHDNLLTDNWRGITLYSFSPYVSIFSNNVTGSEYGIRVVGGSSYLSLTGNLVANSSFYGVGVTGFGSASNYVRISRNVITNNTFYGVIIGNGSNYNTISQNNISENGVGVYIEYSTQNTIYSNNMMNNAQQAYVASGSVNTWDAAYSFGGNYWNDYNGTDANHDGKGDAPYIVNINNMDRYPLVNPFSGIVVPDQYPTIQAAINHANDGDSVFVRAGTYYEHVVVNRTVALVGENRDITIIDGSYIGIVVNVTRDGVNISSFTIRRSGTTWNIGGPPYGVGIYMRNVTDCTISRNKLTQDAAGIQLEFGADGNVIADNTMTSVDLGFGTFDASWNRFTCNNVTSNGRGLSLNVNSDYNVIAGNSIAALEWVIALHACHCNNITDNYVANGQIGVYLPDSSYNRVYHNQIVNNIQQASFYGFTPLLNYWDDGYPSGGNYWSNYGGSDQFHGPHQNETGSDGIGDTAYMLNDSNVDRFPLMVPYGPSPIWPDLNADGVINILDIVIVAGAFGSTQGNSNWNSVADVNRDGIVNILDIVTVALHFGETG